MQRLPGSDACTCKIGRNIEAYVYDIIIKSERTEDLIQDLTETFNNLHRYDMKLNPKMYMFGVPSGKQHGYIVLAPGIKANLT